MTERNPSGRPRKEYGWREANLYWWIFIYCFSTCLL